MIVLAEISTGGIGLYCHAAEQQCCAYCSVDVSWWQYMGCRQLVDCSAYMTVMQLVQQCS
jgi:hypothetical protein